MNKNTQNDDITKNDVTSTGADSGSLHPACSADQRGYAKGYAASLKRIASLKQEIATLRQLKTPLPPPSLPDSHDVTIEYLVTSAETLIGAANMLITMRKENPPNDQADRPERRT